MRKDLKTEALHRADAGAAGVRGGADSRSVTGGAGCHCEQRIMNGLSSRLNRCNL